MNELMRHYKLVVFLLLSIGLWPYASKKVRRIQNILVSTLLWFGLVIQLGVLGPPEHAVNLILRNVSFIIGAISFLIKYNSFLFQIGTIKRVMEQIKYDWETLKVKEELGIIEEHARTGGFYTQLFALIIYPPAFAFILNPFVSDILNVVVPLNKSRQHQCLITTGTILDEEEYFYVFVSVMSMGSLVGTTTLIATEGIFFVWLQHAAATFEIVSYRLRDIIVPDSINKERFSSKSEVRTFADIIDTHRRAIKFFNYLKRTSSPGYFVLSGFGAVSLSIHVFRVSRLLETLTEIGELLFLSAIATSGLIYMYYVNYMISQTIDCSNDIFRDAYNIRWYEAPVATQKMLIIMMQRTAKSITFDMYGFYNYSIEGFGTLVRLSVSYFMALRSLS